MQNGWKGIFVSASESLRTSAANDPCRSPARNALRVCDRSLVPRFQPCTTTRAWNPMLQFPSAMPALGNLLAHSAEGAVTRPLRLDAPQPATSLSCAARLPGPHCTLKVAESCPAPLLAGTALVTGGRRIQSLSLPRHAAGANSAQARSDQFTKRRMRTFITMPSARNVNNTEDPP